MARPKSNQRFATTAKKTGRGTGRKPQAKAKTAKATVRKTPNPKPGHINPDHADLLNKIHKATEDVLNTPANKRPPSNPDVPQEAINALTTILGDAKTVLEHFAQHLRALDRMRLNGVGIKKLGFINRAYELALENSEFLPHYLTLDRFGADIEYFIEFRNLVDLVDQIREKLWNITIRSADIAYTDALDYYAPVREAAKRRVDAAETIFAQLSPFFKHHKPETEQPTEKQELRDYKSLIHGKHDGKIVVENISPKLTGGVHKVIDETYKDSAEFKASEQGEIKE